MKSYTFRVVIEEDTWPGETEGGFRAFVPALEEFGASTFGVTQEEAIKNLQQVLKMILEELLQESQPIPEDIEVSSEPRVTITV
ncbi:MAG: type II toxin-antitoxin system HicB family antitoxin [Candidatus Bipolaricaulia bacterium]